MGSILRHSTCSDPKYRLGPSFCGLAAEFESTAPKGSRRPNRPEKAKRLIDQTRLERSWCCKYLFIYWAWGSNLLHIPNRA